MRTREKVETRPVDTPSPAADSAGSGAARGAAAGQAAVSRSKAGRKRRLHQRRSLVASLQLVVVAALLASWELSVQLGLVKELFVSKPTAVGAALVENVTSDEFGHHLAVTLYETLAGFGIAAVTGVLVGMAFYRIPLLEAVMRPLLTAFNNLPRLALAPLFVLWFGLESMSRIVLVVSVSFFMVLFSTYAGLQNANRDHLLLAKTLGAGQFTLFRRFVLPSAVPPIFAGLQLGLTYAFLAAVVGEMLTGSTGLGAQLQIALSSYRTDDFFAVLLFLVIIATMLSGVMRLLERRILRWRRHELRGLDNE